MPNWNVVEIKALIALKHRLYKQETIVSNKRDLMVLEASRWLQISSKIMSARMSTSIRDSPSCKNKWNQIILEFKRIVDFHVHCSSNKPSYWNLNPVARKVEGLPRVFAKDIFHHIHK